MGWSLLGWFEAGIIAGCRAKKSPGVVGGPGLYLVLAVVPLGIFAARKTCRHLCFVPLVQSHKLSRYFRWAKNLPAVVFCAFSAKPQPYSSLPKGAKQMQQAREQVIDVQVQAHCRHDVVGLAAVDDAAGVKQDKA